ncbi:MAG: S1 RNA-binding domain-containing protein [Methylococcales bacterium]
MYVGTVESIHHYGLIVRLPDGRSGLLHITSLPADAMKRVKLKERIRVRVIEIDSLGRIRLSAE